MWEVLEITTRSNYVEWGTRLYKGSLLTTISWGVWNDLESTLVLRDSAHELSLTVAFKRQRPTRLPHTRTPPVASLWHAAAGGCHLKAAVSVIRRATLLHPNVTVNYRRKVCDDSIREEKRRTSRRVVCKCAQVL